MPDWEGEDLVNGGNAVKVADSPPPKRARKKEPEPVKQPEPVEEPEAEVQAETETEPEVEGEAEVEDKTEAEAGEAGPPRPAASKQEWIDWAVSQGAEWITATNSTKQQLMEQYGQRP